MKRFKKFSIFLLLIFNFLLIPGSNAGWNPYILKTTFGQVTDSTGSTYNRGDFTATNAFFWSSLNLSAYAGTDAGYTSHYIEALDSAGKKATGYIGAVGAGETLGNEIVVNGGFDSDTIWTKEAGWTIAGGVGVATNVTSAIFQNQLGSFIVGGLYKGVSDWTRTGGESAFGLGLIGWFNQGITVNGNYIGYLAFKSVGDGDISGYGWGFTGTIDNYFVKRVTDSPSTAVHIVSSLNGTTRDWASIESGFDPNNIASWKIYLL